MNKILLFFLAFSSSQVFATNFCEKWESISFNDCTLTTYDHGPANTGFTMKKKYNAKIESVFKEGQYIINFSDGPTEDGTFAYTTSYGVQTPVVTEETHIPYADLTYERSAECKIKHLVLNIKETVNYHNRDSRHIAKNRQVVRVAKNAVIIEYYTKSVIQKLPNGPSYEMDPYQGNPSNKLVCKRM